MRGGVTGGRAREEQSESRRSAEETPAAEQEGREMPQAAASDGAEDSAATGQSDMTGAQADEDEMGHDDEAETAPPEGEEDQDEMPEAQADEGDMADGEDDDGQMPGAGHSGRGQGSAEARDPHPVRRAVLNVALPAATATIGAAGGLLLARTAMQGNRRPHNGTGGMELASVAQQLGEASRQFGRLTQEVMAVGATAERISKSIGR